jgi:hypothetical protein
LRALLSCGLFTSGYIQSLAAGRVWLVSDRVRVRAATTGQSLV